MMAAESVAMRERTMIGSGPTRRAPERCGWIIDGDAGLTCDRKATRGTMATGPLCDEHGEEHERESEGR